VVYYPNEENSILTVDFSGRGLTSLKGLNHLNRIEYAQRVNLSDNKLTELEPQIFNSILHLTIIDLSNNDLSKLPAKLFENIVIGTIDLRGNKKLTQIDPAVFNKKSRGIVLNIDKGSLSKNNIEELKARGVNIQEY
jgi:Leucine-rich repeat (LRR) protein